MARLVPTGMGENRRIASKSVGMEALAPSVMEALAPSAMEALAHVEAGHSRGSPPRAGLTCCTPRNAPARFPHRVQSQFASRSSVGFEAIHASAVLVVGNLDGRKAPKIEC
jgi:hypothetical protein